MFRPAMSFRTLHTMLSDARFWLDMPVLGWYIRARRFTELKQLSSRGRSSATSEGKESDHEQHSRASLPLRALTLVALLLVAGPSARPAPADDDTVTIWTDADRKAAVDKIASDVGHASAV